MQKITKENAIFKSPAFQKDATAFALIIQNLDMPTLKLYSDEETYIICRGKTEYPTWIWTKDHISPDKIPEIQSVMDLYLTDEEKTKFTCKKELYNFLLQYGYDKLNLDDYFEMGSLTCHQTKKPRPCDGYMNQPTQDDKEILTQYWYADCQEMNGVDSITQEQALTDAQTFIDSGTFYVWRNPTGKIVCMVSYKENLNQARLSHVYTPDEERQKGYAANLIYELTNLLLAKNLNPLLYTDYNYIPSNKAYINAGYEDTGILINFSCSKEKIKNNTL